MDTLDASIGTFNAPMSLVSLPLYAVSGPSSRYSIPLHRAIAPISLVSLPLYSVNGPLSRHSRPVRPGHGADVPGQSSVVRGQRLIGPGPTQTWPRGHEGFIGEAGELIAAS